MFVDFIVRGFDLESSSGIARLAAERGCDVNTMIKELIVAGLATIAHERVETAPAKGAVSAAAAAAASAAANPGWRSLVFDDRVDEEILAAARLIP